MKKNVKKLDRIARLVLAIILIGLYVMNIVTGTQGMIALGVAAIMLLTATIAICPLYTILGACCSKNCSTEKHDHDSGCCGECGSEDKTK